MCVGVRRCCRGDCGMMVVPGRISPVNNGSLAVEGWAGNGCEGRAGLC